MQSSFALRRLPRGVCEKNSPSLVTQLLAVVKAGSYTVLSQNEPLTHTISEEVCRFLHFVSRIATRRCCSITH